MPFTHAMYQCILTEHELVGVRKAYALCCELLGGKPSTPEGEALLANFVLRAFEDNDHDAESAAQEAYEIVIKLQ